MMVGIARYPVEEVCWESAFCSELKEWIGKKSKTKDAKRWEEFSEEEKIRIAGHSSVVYEIAMVAILISIYVAGILAIYFVFGEFDVGLLAASPEFIMFRLLFTFDITPAYRAGIDIAWVAPALFAGVLVSLSLGGLSPAFRSKSGKFYRDAKQRFIYFTDHYLHWRKILLRFGPDKHLFICRAYPRCRNKSIGIIEAETADGKKRKIRFCYRHNPETNEWIKQNLYFKGFEVKKVYYHNPGEADHF